MRPVPESQRLGTVDLLRCAAASAVLWCHTCSATGDPWLSAMGSWGRYGVDVFFVISGFIVPLAMWRAKYACSRDTTRFLACRLARLDPPYFVATAAAALISFAAWKTPGFRGPPPPFSLAATFAHVGYLNDLLGLPWYNGVSWSLAIEFQFYVAIAACFALIVAGERWHCGAFVAALVAAALAARWGGWGEATIVRWLPLFVMGITAFRWHQGIASTAGFVIMQLAAVVAGLVMGRPMGVLAGALAAMFLAFCNVTAPRVVAGYAAMTYSLYLVHEPLVMRIVHLVERLGEGVAITVVAMASGIVLSLAAAGVFWWFVELPSLKWAASIKQRGSRTGQRRSEG